MRLNKYKCTVDQELECLQWADDVMRARMASGQPANAVWRAAGGRGCCICSTQRWADILKLKHYITNPTLTIDAYIYMKNNPAKFHPDRIWNDGVLFFFEHRTRTTRWVVIWDQFLIQNTCWIWQAAVASQFYEKEHRSYYKESTHKCPRIRVKVQ